MHTTEYDDQTDPTPEQNAPHEMPTVAEPGSRQPETTAAPNEAAQWTLILRKFRQHRMAVTALWLLVALAVIGLFCDFLSPNDPNRRYTGYMQMPPNRVRFVHPDSGFSLRPFVYGVSMEMDRTTYRRTYREDTDRQYYVRFLSRGHEYRLLGVIRTDIHLFTADEPGVLFLFGTDDMGRDVFSRVLYGTRISLSVGMLGVALSFFLGCILGGISGFIGGAVDVVIQRTIEFLLSIPTIPLWMSLSISLPKDWSPIRVYFFITIILSIVGWCGLARVVRGKIMSVREEDYVLAAVAAGATQAQIIRRHMLPAFTSYLIVSLTISIPSMILGETALSFLGLGLRPPVISWGVLLRNAQDIRAVAVTPWQLLPALFVVVTVLAFNFVGDGLRDAADPYRS